MVTYSDDYDTLDIHGWNYCLMDEILFIIYALSMVSGMAMIYIDCSPIFLCRRYADCLRAGASVGLLWPTHFMDDSCAMRKCGSWDVHWWSNDVTIVYCIHLHMGVRMFHFSYNRTRHVSQRMNGVAIASKRMHDTIS